VSTRSGGIFEVGAKQARLEELDRQAAMPEFWLDQEGAQKVLKEKGGIERVVNDWKYLAGRRDDVATLLELAEEAQDDDAAAEARTILVDLEKRLGSLETRRLLSGELDGNDVIVEINAGEGGTDAADWADMLSRMYGKWATAHGFQVELLDRQEGEEAGIRSTAFAIRGPYAFGYLQSEIGVHRLVRISPFDQNARRQTAFAAVAAYPEIDDDIQIEINPADIEMQTMRASGAGGQHVNTTDSAVRLIHRPTGVAVKCSAERSQHKNRDKAMKMLKARLYQLELEKRQAAQDAANAQKKKIGFGSQIRSYVLAPYQQVKDLRTGETSGDAHRVLEGDLDRFIDSWLAARAEGRLGEGAIEAD
jgi:peptide chain release factor 2